MRHQILAIASLLLAACEAGGGGARTGQGPDSAVARFVAGGEVSVVQVTVSDARPLRSAELLGPDGAVTQAYSIDVLPTSAGALPSYAPTLGSGINLTIGGGVPGSQTVTYGQLHAVALIRLADPQDYRRTWRDWQLRLRLGDPPNVTFVMLLAPQPPP